MIELLRDPIWQFVGAALALLALAAAFWIYLLQRQKKELAYGVLSTRRLLSVASELRSRVSVTIDGRPVEDLHLIVVGIKNSGNTSIAEADYLYALTLHVKDKTEIISAEVSKFFPSNLLVSLSFQPDKLEFKPPLLNPGDYFTVQALVSGKSPAFTSDFRLIGTSKTELLRRSRPFSDTGDKVAIGFWIALLSSLIFTSTLMNTVAKKIIFAGIPFAIISAIFYTWARSRFGAEASRYIDDA